ncbi:MAG: hypothetical protein IPM23_00040 [Candidatus Melainabacteria bacterium]|nr:hypothetical protein [Candidatus Melainabacteria bacterium]
MKITGIALLAYDTSYFEESVKGYLDLVDEVLIGLDENRQTWTGKFYDLDSSIVEKLLAISPKVKIVEDQFFIPGLAPMENETRERNVLSSLASDVDWLLSIDSDEILINPNDLSDYLANASSGFVLGSWITVFKELDDAYLVIGKDKAIHLWPTAIATNRSEAYINARWTDQRPILSPALLLHFSWARTEDELRQKLQNWGHSNDFNVSNFLDMWLKADEKSYRDFRNFHPMTPEAWPELIRIPKNDLRNECRRLVANIS